MTTRNRKSIDIDMIQTGDGVQVGYVGEVTNVAKPQSGSVTWHILSWISAEDELPESVNDTVLVYVSMGHGFGYMETAHYLHREKRWITPRQEAVEDSQCKVTHWMKLPEPPEME